MAGTAKQFRILFVAAEPEQAKAILSRLTAARLHVRALFTQYPDKLRAVTSEHPCDLILVRIGGTIAASEVAAVRRETGARTPLLILDQNQSDPGELVELMSVGADGLIRDLDDGRLVFLIRRWIAQADAMTRLPAPPAYATARAADLRGSIEPDSMPIAQDQSIDAETGLPDRRALLSELAHRLGEAPSPQNRQVTLLYARIQDFDSICQGYGLTRGLEHAATIVSNIRAAMLEDAFTARVADDACVILLAAGTGSVPESVGERLLNRLAHLAPDAATPLLRLGLASGNPGEVSAANLLDQAFAHCVLASPTTPGARAPQASGLKMARSQSGEPPAGQSGGHPTSVLDATPELTLGPEFVPEFVPKPVPELSLGFGPNQGAGFGSPPGAGSSFSADPESDLVSIDLDACNRYGPNDDEGMLDESVIASIERALETNGFTVMYQPIISLMGASQEHYSVLVRLRGGRDQLLTASELLGFAARAGHLPNVDRWVMQCAFQEQARRRRLGQQVSLFLSLSKEIVQDERLLIWICDSLREFGIRGSWVTFQLQQSEALALSDKWTLLAEGLKKIQCRICINQVGLTADTEGSMHGMQADFIKFAPELAAGLGSDQATQTRLLQLIKTAQLHDSKTIVTGVEDARALALLWSTGIDYVQGNFLHEALPRLDAPK